MTHNACQTQRDARLGQQTHPQPQCFVLVHIHHVPASRGAEEHTKGTHQRGDDAKTQGVDEHREV